jgi:hypothetical protein
MDEAIPVVRQAGLETWIPCLVLSHVWALFFVAKALAVLNPELYRRITNKILSPGKRASTLDRTARTLHHDGDSCGSVSESGAQLPQRW